MTDRRPHLSSLPLEILALIVRRLPHPTDVTNTVAALCLPVADAVMVAHQWQISTRFHELDNGIDLTRELICGVVGVYATHNCFRSFLVALSQFFVRFPPSTFALHPCIYFQYPFDFMDRISELIIDYAKPLSMLEAVVKGWERIYITIRQRDSIFLHTLLLYACLRRANRAYFYHFMSSGTSTGLKDIFAEQAAIGGDVELISYIHEKGLLNTRNDSLCTEAASHGHLEALQWLVEHKCFFKINVCADKASESGHQQIIEWMIKAGYQFDCDVAYYACKGGHLELMRWAIEKGLTSSTPLEFLEIAAEKNRWHIVNWILHNHPELQGDELETTLFEACKSGRFDIMELLYSKKAPLRGEAFRGAFLSRSNRMDVVRWLQERNCEIDPNDLSPCVASALAGNLDMLQLARSLGLPWSAKATFHAAENSHVDVLDWAISNGCPWSEEEIIDLAEQYEGFDDSVMKWLKKKTGYKSRRESAAIEQQRGEEK